MIVSAIVFIGITFIGGMWSASLSNVMNIVLIYVGILIATVVQFYRVGGMDGLAASLPAGVPWFSFTEGVGMVGSNINYRKPFLAEHFADFARR